MKKDYLRNVSLLCPVCGNDHFVFNEENEKTKYKCSDCGKEFSRDGIIEENEDVVSNVLDEIIDEFMSNTEKELNKTIGKLFK